MGRYRSRIDGPVNRSAAAVGARDTLLESDNGPCAFVAVAALHALVQDVLPVPDVPGIALPVVAALLSAVVAAVGTDVVAVSVAESDLASVAAPAPAGFAGTGAQSVLVAAVGARVVPSGPAPIPAASARAAAGLASAFALAASVPAERDVPVASALALISVACVQAADLLFVVAASHPLRAFALPARLVALRPLGRAPATPGRRRQAQSLSDLRYHFSCSPPEHSGTSIAVKRNREHFHEALTSVPLFYFATASS